MAFSLFKKKNFADRIFTAAKIYTLDEEYPEAEAVAVKDGKVLAVGSAEEIEGFSGASTEKIELPGKFILPGFISLAGNCAEVVTKDVLRIEENTENNNEEESDENENEQEGAADGENEASADAGEEPSEPSEEDLRIMDEYNSALSENQKMLQKAFNSKGFTSVLSIETDRRADIYKDVLIDLYQNEELSIRYFGSFALTKMIDPRILQSYLESRRVACIELGEMINFGNLDILNSSSAEDPNFMPEDYLRSCCKLIASHGFSIRFTPSDRDAALTDIDIAGELSESYGKQAFIVQHDLELEASELSEVFTGSAVVLDKESRSWKGAAEEVARHSFEAAHAIGKGRLLGSIEKGKAADFAVFTEDPFSVSSKEEFDALRASNIIISGIISVL